MSLNVKGTVFSGHPTRTTFGNTLRVVSYWRYILRDVPRTHYRLYVCGDDVMLRVVKGFYPEEYMTELYS